MAFSKLYGRFPHSWAKPDWATHNSTHPREQGQIGGNKRHGRYKATSVLASDFYNKPAALLLLLEWLIWTISLSFQKEQNYSHLRAGLWPCGIRMNYLSVQQVVSLSSTVKSLMRGKWGGDIAQNSLGEPKQSLLHDPALRERGKEHIAVAHGNVGGFLLSGPGTLLADQAFLRVTATVGSSGLISPLNVPVLFLFFPGMLTERSSHTQISSKIKSGINYLSTQPSWWLYGFAAFAHVEGSLPFYYKHIHLIKRRAVSIKCPPFVFALFTVLDSKEPLALLPKWLGITTALWRQQERSNCPSEGASIHPRAIKSCASEWFRCF